MLKHRKMNTPKKDVAKEASKGMTVKGKETMKNKEIEEAVGKEDSLEAGKGNKKAGELEAKDDKDSRSKNEDNRSVETKEGEKIFDEAIKVAHAEIAAKKKESEDLNKRKGSGGARAASKDRASSIRAGKERSKEKGNHGGKRTKTEVKKLPKAGNGGEKVVVEEKEEEEEGTRAEAKEVEEEASRRIQGLEPAEEEKEEKGEMGKANYADKLGKVGPSSKLSKEGSTNKLDKEMDKAEDMLDEVSSNKKDSVEKVSAGKKDSDVEKVLSDEKDSTLEKVLDELEPSKDEKCCGFKGIEPVGGRYVQI